MDFSFDETQDAVSKLARKVFGERVTPESLKKLDAQVDRFDARLWADLAQVGLLGVAIPEAYGGAGHGFLELCALLEEAGAAVAPVPLWATLVLGALPIAELGTDEQKKRFLPGIARGETFLTAALAEATSNDASRPATLARPDRAGWSIDGSKVCVPAAHLAARILVPAHLGDGQTAVFLVDPRAQGVKLERQIMTTGEPHAKLTLANAHVESDDILGGPLPNAAVLEWIVARATVALCAMELGIAERVLRMTASYTSTRQQFDRPIATFQAVSQRAADRYIDVEAIRVATWHAVWQLSAGIPAAQAISIAKFWAAEGGHRTVYAAQHLHAGIGFDVDYPLHRYYLLSKQIELTLGSAPLHIAALGAALANG